MIHVMREKETLEAVGKLFGSDEAEIIKANSFGGELLCAEGAGVWVPCGKRVEFNEITDEKTCFDLQNTDYFSLSALHTVTENDNSFVPADLWGRNLSEIFIDGYITENGSLNLPYDYPAINACLINGVKPSFALKDAAAYLEGDMLTQLLHDLSFKEYERGLVTAQTPDEAAAAARLIYELNENGYETIAAGGLKALLRIKAEGAPAKQYLYMSEANLFDFGSFEQNIKKLLTSVSAEESGVIYTPRFIKVNKKTGKIDYISAAQTAEALNGCEEKKIFFDETSQLNIFTVKDEQGGETSFIYEDTRSLYAKCALLKHSGVRNICFSALDENMPRLAGAAQLAADMYKN